MRAALMALVLGSGAGCTPMPEPDMTYAGVTRSGCPEGAIPVTTSGVTNCAHTAANTVATGTERAMTQETLAELRAQVDATGEPAAYTDGEITMTVYPKP